MGACKLTVWHLPRASCSDKLLNYNSTLSTEVSCKDSCHPIGSVFLIFLTGNLNLLEPRSISCKVRPTVPCRFFWTVYGQSGYRTPVSLVEYLLWGFDKPDYALGRCKLADLGFAGLC